MIHKRLTMLGSRQGFFMIKDVRIPVFIESLRNTLPLKNVICDSYFAFFMPCDKVTFSLILENKCAFIFIGHEGHFLWIAKSQHYMKTGKRLSF